MGIGAFGTWVLWLKTRTMVPVNIPISMGVGHVRTREFELNLNAPYAIDIEVQKAIPFDTLNCLLGMAKAESSTELEKCRNLPSVLKAIIFAGLARYRHQCYNHSSVLSRSRSTGDGV